MDDYDKEWLERSDWAWQWNNVDIPGPSLDGSVRKERLFHCACCRRGLERYGNELEVGRQVIDTLEGFADGAAVREQVDEALRCADLAHLFGSEAASSPGNIAIANAVRFACLEDSQCTYDAANAVAYALTNHRVNIYTEGDRTSPCPNLLGEERAWQDAQEDEMKGQAAIYGDIFPPFDVPLPQEWLNQTVEMVAQGIYSNRRFEDLPALSDALEEAGCTNTEILMHCWSPGPHVRGCWVIDLILGKK